MGPRICEGHCRLHVYVSGCPQKRRWQAWPTESSMQASANPAVVGALTLTLLAAGVQELGPLADL